MTTRARRPPAEGKGDAPADTPSYEESAERRPPVDASALPAKPKSTAPPGGGSRKTGPATVRENAGGDATAGE